MRCSAKGFNRLKLQKKLFLSFLFLSIIPAVSLIVAFYFLLTSSLDRWVNENVLKSLEESLAAMRMIGEEFDYKIREGVSDVTQNSAFLDDLREGRVTSVENTLRALKDVLEVNYVSVISPAESVLVATDSLFPESDFSDMLHQITLQRTPRGQIIHLSDLGIVYTVFPFGGGAGVLVAASLLSSSMGKAASDLTSVMMMYRKIDFLKEPGKKALLVFISLMVLLLAGMSVVVSGNLSREISRPLDELVEAAERVGSGDFDVKVHAADGSKEIGQLVDSFNRMTDELKKTKKRLLEAERLAAWRNSARKMAHELKNPLTPLSLSLTRLKKRSGAFHEERDTIMECIDAMEREVKNLLAVSQQFSRFAKMPAPRRAPCAPGTIVEQVARFYLAENPDIQWSNRCGDMQIMADREQLHRLFANLVKNAIEAMNGAGVIRVSTEMVTQTDGAGGAGDDDLSGRGRGSFMKITFEDSGPGIPRSNLSRVFDPYFSTKTRGTGLGLAIVRQIAVDHGGYVKASNRQGGGAAFIISLPAE
jgi:nitrogen fixation/metabolism regulation signal transduction histidine kinase